jgi:hypothetical protein
MSMVAVEASYVLETVRDVGALNSLCALCDGVCSQNKQMDRNIEQIRASADT